MRICVVWAVGVLAACGGEVERPSQGGTAGVGAGGVAAGGSGSGAVAAGGVGPGGASGNDGSAAWGGTGGTTCPPIPSCNWCNGSPKLDIAGCLTGWVCSNGADPCNTPPCEGKCPTGQKCAPDELCWPDATPPTCVEQQCSGPTYDCTCTWTCSNGHTYASACSFNSLMYSCSCTDDDVQVESCSGYMSDGGAPNACTMGSGCCAKLPQ